MAPFISDFLSPPKLRHSQSLVRGDLKGGGHVDEGGETVQVVAVALREDGVGLRERVTFTH